jgi:hypothetical protein
MKQSKVCLLPTSGGVLFGLILDFEDGCGMFLQNVGSFSADYTALYPITTAVRISNHKDVNCTILISALY